jgi:hypothetical protein
MTPTERAIALKEMQKASDAFCHAAVKIGNPTFVEFTGIINQYIEACRQAHHNGIDFTQCNTHCQQELPLESFQIDYINEKLACIFTARSLLNPEARQKTGPRQKHPE